MGTLDQFSALSDEAWAVAEVTADLERTWGIPPEVRWIAERLGMSQERTRHHCRRLAEAGVAAWLPGSDRVSVDESLPVLGEVA